ncbi:Xenotropic and polytropic retrovirus receptor 1 [Blastocladiella emersonii ATCC 22665]|nr:Xenotropic and polytropic retrovirus receptor 1 [Blastocladiella emersonii ATCC 22665]
MKFAKTLRSEAVPEWLPKYINYRGLKKKLTRIEREIQALRDAETAAAAAAGQRSPPLSRGSSFKFRGSVPASPTLPSAPYSPPLGAPPVPVVPADLLRAAGMEPASGQRHPLASAISPSDVGDDTDHLLPKDSDSELGFAMQPVDVGGSGASQHGNREMFRVGSADSIVQQRRPHRTSEGGTASEYHPLAREAGSDDSLESDSGAAPTAPAAAAATLKSPTIKGMAPAHLMAGGNATHPSPRAKPSIHSNRSASADALGALPDRSDPNLPHSSSSGLLGSPLPFPPLQLEVLTSSAELDKDIMEGRLRAMQAPLSPAPTASRKNSFRSTFTNYRRRMQAHGSHFEPDTHLDAFLNTRPQVERDFFEMLDGEMRKITDFFNDQVAHHHETMAKIKRLIAELDHREAPRRPNSDDMSIFNMIRPAIPLATRSSKTKVLRNAMLEYYRALTLMRNYQILNFTGLFKQILKKFDKTAGWRSSRIYITDRKYLLSWDQDPVVRDLLKETEALYCNFFSKGHRQAGMKELRLPDKRRVTHQEETWLSGFFIGAGLCLLLQSVISIVKGQSYLKPHFVPLVQVYGGFLMPIVFGMLFVWCLYKWSVHGVNYVFIFEFNSRDHIHYLEFLEIPSFLFLLWSIFVFLTLTPVNEDLDVSPLMLPLIFASICLAFFVNPFPILHRNARWWLIRTLSRILASPFHKIYFRDFFLTDIMCSLVFSLNSLPLFFCVSLRQDEACDTSRSPFSLAFAILPVLLRLIQCVRRTYDSGNVHPHMTNAGKYCFSLSVICASFVWRYTDADAWFWAWIALSACATAYAIVWDSYMDWGLCDRNHQFLRADRIFAPPGVYYFALCSNAVLRLGWILQISPGHWLPTVSVTAVTLILALLEAVRRVQWCLYRMEAEHLVNVGQWRATKEIPLPLRNSSDDDEEHGMAVLGGGGGAGAGRNRPAVSMESRRSGSPER